MRIAVCDNNIRDQERVLAALRDYDPTRKPECFLNGSDLLAAATTGPPFDIAFLDIYLPGENGVDVANELLKISPTTGVVFVTTSMDHAIDAFSLGAIHYLVKPVTTEGVTEAFRRLNVKRKTQRPMIVLTVSDSILTLYLDEISYIKSVGHAKKLNIINGKTIRVWMSMKELESKLGSTFLKLNHRFLINMEQIEQMGNDSCKMHDGVELDFARRKCAAIHMTYDNYLFDCLSTKTKWSGGRL